MNRHQRRRDEVRNPAMATAMLKAMRADLDKARDGVERLAEMVEAGRAMGRDVTGDEERLAELIAQVGAMSTELARLQ